MHTILTLQVAVRKLATLNRHGNALDTSLITFLHVGNGHLISMSLSPAHIHTHQHRSPILTLRTTGTWINLEYTVHRVFLLAKHILQFQVFYRLDSLVIVSIHFLLGHHLIFIEVESKLQFVSIETYLLIAIQPFLDAFYFLHLLLSILRIFPKVRSLSTELFLLKFYFFLVYIQITMESVSTIHHIFQLVSCYHFYYLILKITSCFYFRYLTWSYSSYILSISAL